MRLDRYLSHGTGAPRRDVGGWLRAGRVEVDGVVVQDGGAAVTSGVADVRLDGERVHPFSHLVLVMHKPAGSVCSADDAGGPSVLALVPGELRHPDLHPVGRLDKDTTGLLLLTTDGGLSHALTHPRRHVDKSYLAELARDVDADAADRFAAGLRLADGTECQPATLERLGPALVRVGVREGRYHQVKRMIAACGGSVARLHRDRVGPLCLDPQLPVGAVRPATPAEIAALATATGRSAGGPR
ncbi:MAG: rRNA pseudouridine synthase [Myxococcales bacterium]|nr:rRNA pseudouridine synthase [Myxococcales bacterium]